MEPIDVETLRTKLRAMSRAEARQVAFRAGLSCSTVEKFRLARIKEPKLSKLRKLAAVFSEPPGDAQPATAP